MSGRPAVFVDRDGTLNELVYDAEHGRLDSPFEPAQLVLRPGAGAFLAELNRRGWWTVLVTNQPGVAKGTLTVARVEAIHRALRVALAAAGARLDAVHYSPFHPDPGPAGRPEFTRQSPCRKPECGMWRRAALRDGIDLSASITVGDGFVDVEAGRRAGTRTVLLTRAKAELFDWFARHPHHRPDCLAESFADALEFIGVPAGRAAGTAGLG